MIYANGEYFVPVDTVSELLDYSYSWDIEKNQDLKISVEKKK